MRQTPGAVRSNAELRLTPAHQIGLGRRAQPRRAGGQLAGTTGVFTHGLGSSEAGGSVWELASLADEAWGGLLKSGMILISAGLRFLAQEGCRQPKSCFVLEGFGVAGGEGRETRARKMLPNCYRFGKGSGAGPRSA